MSKDHKTLPKTPPTDGYEVGYGKPPEASRFRKGQSGNPKGRPKGARNKRLALNEERLKGIFLDEVYRTITIREGDRDVVVSMAQAIVRSLSYKAAKGDFRSQRVVLDALSRIEKEDKDMYYEWLETVIGYKLYWEGELDRRKRLGITSLPDPSPHPDQIHVDFHENTATVTGPVTKDEKEQQDTVRAIKSECLDRLVELNSELEVQQIKAARAEIKDKIAIRESVVRKANRALGLD